MQITGNSNRHGTKSKSITKKHNWYSEAEMKKYDQDPPIYVNSRAQWKGKPGEFVVSFWAKRSSKSKLYELESAATSLEGGVWRCKKLEMIMIDGKNTEVTLADRVKNVNGLNFP